MSVSDLCKIKGNDKVKKNIENIKKAYFTLNNLAQVEQILNLIKLNLDKQDKLIIASLTVNALITYGKCFNTGYCFKLSHVIFNNELHSGAVSNEITERNFHNLIMSYRNQHVAHSDILLTVLEVGACKLEDRNGGGC